MPKGAIEIAVHAHEQIAGRDQKLAIVRAIVECLGLASEHISNSNQGNTLFSVKEV
jgi:hypothetical protein